MGRQLKQDNNYIWFHLLFKPNSATKLKRKNTKIDLHK